MADNLAVTAGSGTTVATDQRSSDSAHFQMVKIVGGALDTFNIVLVDSNGNVPVVNGKVTTATPNNVTTSTTNATLVASNTARKGASVRNDSTASYLYVNVGATASSTAHVVKLSPGDYWEVPFGYTGSVTGVLDAGTATARVCEYTA